jgi:hypothetical protein
VGELIDATPVAPAGEIGVEKCQNASLGHVAADQSGAQR